MNKIHNAFEFLFVIFCVLAPYIFGLVGLMMVIFKLTNPIWPILAGICFIFYIIGWLTNV